MDTKTLISHLDHEYALMAAALAAADPAATVPTCPDWTAADLEEHVSMVFMHKAECMRRGEFPKPWPPEGGVGSLAECYAVVTAEFAHRRPEDASATWFEPDQTVGFWVRRMAQEAAIHRVDAEMVAGGTISPIADDLAVDGIDEFLRCFVAYGSEDWHDYFAEVLATADPRPVLVSAGGRGWTVAPTPERIVVADANTATTTDATVTGEPGLVYRWLWNRGGDVQIDGDDDLIRQLRALMAPAMG